MIRYTLLLLLCITCNLGQIKAQKQVRSFIFGHSLLDHRPPINPTPSDETTVPHWLFLLSEEAGNDYAATGKYGFLPQHANLPPFAQWGYDIVPEVWDSDNEEFHEADFNNVILTAGNFMQWQPSDSPYPGDTVSPVSATRRIVNWVQDQEDSIGVYIYENWPDMAPYLNSGFPPNASEFERYHNYTVGEFHDWWIEYHDFILTTHPTVKMIPVGPILAHLMQLPELENISANEWYEDDAPHGRPNVYFLASVITYMATCQENAPRSFSVPGLIHPDIQSNWSKIIEEVWSELWSYNLPNGESRVFFKKMTTSTVDIASDILVGPNPFVDHINVDVNSDQELVLRILNLRGQVLFEKIVRKELNIPTTEWPTGTYLMTLENTQGEVRFRTEIVKHIK